MQQQAKNIIYNSITPAGILASSNDIDNYARIWSRDAMMTGLCGLIIDDEKIIRAHRSSIETLSKYQSSNGQIPSNVQMDAQCQEAKSISYGSTVGRIDATTWWLIGTLSYIILRADQKLYQQLEHKINKAFNALDHWEYNDKGLIYTPLGGNWADEYIISGYTLFDNSLRVWAYHLYSQLNNNLEVALKYEQTRKIVIDNFNYDKNSSLAYHPTAYQVLNNRPKQYLPASLNANGYATYWDMAGNAMAMMLGLNDKTANVMEYLHYLNKDIGHWMLPTFFPIIEEGDADWSLLNNNYSYNFKNKPYHFHNGGSWPIFLGWLCTALQKQGDESISHEILNAYEQVLSHDNTFKEYVNIKNKQGGGMSQLCFSAVGYLLMQNKTKNRLESIL